jgi:hypothetical protein
MGNIHAGGLSSNAAEDGRRGAMYTVAFGEYNGGVPLRLARTARVNRLARFVLFGGETWAWSLY